MGSMGRERSGETERCREMRDREWGPRKERDTEGERERELQGTKING